MQYIELLHPDKEYSIIGRVLTNFNGYIGLEIWNFYYHDESGSEQIFETKHGYSNTYFFALVETIENIYLFNLEERNSNYLQIH